MTKRLTSEEIDHFVSGHFAIDKRTADIVAMRQDGKTYTEAGAAFGISASRSRDIYLGWQSSRKHAAEVREFLAGNDPADIPLDLLPSRIAQTIPVMLVHVNTVRDLLSMSESDLLELRRLGRKAVLEIRDMLADLGLEMAGP